MSRSTRSSTGATKRKVYTDESSDIGHTLLTAVLSNMGANSTGVADTLKLIRQLKEYQHPYMLPPCPGTVVGGRVHDRNVRALFEGKNLVRRTPSSDASEHHIISCIAGGHAIGCGRGANGFDGEQNEWLMPKFEHVVRVAVLVDLGREWAKEKAKSNYDYGVEKAFERSVLAYDTYIVNGGGAPILYLPTPPGVYASAFYNLAIFDATTGALQAYFNDINDVYDGECYGHTQLLNGGSEDAKDVRHWQLWVRGVRGEEEDEEDEPGTNGLGISFDYATRSSWCNTGPWCASGYALHVLSEIEYLKSGGVDPDILLKNVPADALAEAKMIKEAPWDEETNRPILPAQAEEGDGDK